MLTVEGHLGISGSLSFWEEGVGKAIHTKASSLMIQRQCIVGTSNEVHLEDKKHICQTTVPYNLPALPSEKSKRSAIIVFSTGRGKVI